MLGYLSIKQIGPEVFRQSYSAKKNPFENNHRTFYSQILRKKRKKNSHECLLVLESLRIFFLYKLLIC